MAVDPRYRVGARCDTRADVKLEHDAFVGVRGENLHRHLPVDGMPFGVVIVISGVQAL